MEKPIKLSKAEMDKYEKQARDKIVRARTQLLIDNGFFGFLALQLRLVVSWEMPTAWVDGVSMGYNPKFICELDEREVEFVFAHELMHCCLKHFSRRQGRDPRGWNIAGDFYINGDLVKANVGKMPKCGLIDAKYDGLTTEEIFDRIPVIKINISGDGGSGDGKGGQGNQQDPGGCGGVRDTPGDAGVKEEASQAWDATVRAAVAVAKANGIGKLPGSIQALINQLQQPKVSWRDLTRRFIDQSMSKDVSWSRLSRRSVSLGTLMPGYVSDRLNHLVMIVDVSGSISEKVLIEFVSEIAGALDEGTADAISVVYADTDVQHVDHFVQGDAVTAKMMRGGGTAFSNSFKWVAENAPQANAVIYLTDLEVHDFGQDPNIPTLWAVYNTLANYPRLIESVPFGEPIHVSDPYS